MQENKTAKSVILYVSLAFGLPLICVLLIKNLSVFQAGTPNFMLFGFEAMTPVISALLATAMLGGRKELSAFLRKLYIRNIKISYILLAAIMPIAVLTATKLTLLLSGNAAQLLSSITLKKLVIVLWALVAEEIGWRGFFQENVGAKFGYITTPLIVGGVWALWHFHFFWTGTMSAPILLFMLGCIAESYGYYWVTERSKGNIIPASVWHFTGNLFISLYTIAPSYNNGSTLPYLLFVGYTILMALIIVFCEHNARKCVPGRYQK